MEVLGLDLDGVIVDTALFKKQAFKRWFGLDFESWQLTSNVIDDYVVDREMRREVGKLSGVSIHTDFTESEMLKTLEQLKRRFDRTMIISARAKSQEGVCAANKTLEILGLKEIFAEKDILFFPTYDFKVKFISKECTTYVDDRQDIIEKLALTPVRAVLYDPFNLVDGRKYALPRGATKVRRLIEVYNGR